MVHGLPRVFACWAECRNVRRGDHRAVIAETVADERTHLGDPLVGVGVHRNHLGDILLAAHRAGQSIEQDSNNRVAMLEDFCASPRGAEPVLPRVRRRSLAFRCRVPMAGEAEFLVDRLPLSEFHHLLLAEVLFVDAMPFVEKLSSRSV